MVVRATMDFFQHRYFKTTKTLMTLIGQWPGQCIRTSRCIVGVIILLVGSLSIPVTMAAIEYHDNRTILVDCLAGIGYGGGCGLRLATCIINSKKLSMMLNHIRADWFVWAREREVSILHEYAEIGRKFTYGYAAAMYTMGLFWIIQPIFPKIIDVVLNNGSKPGQFPLPMYYHDFDLQKYYFCIMIYVFLCMTATITVTITYDVMLIAFVTHGCGIFAAVGHQLERIGNDEGSESIDQRGRTPEQMICSSIARHNEAIEYAKLIDKTFTWAFFITAVFRIGILSMVGLQIVTRIDQTEETIRFAFFAIALIIYVYMESCAAQILMDHSTSVRDHIQNGQWYNLSIKAQRLLYFIIMRCEVPCQLTGGGMITMSVESFAVFLKTSMSYLTVLRSM